MAHERIIFARTRTGGTAFASASDFITRSAKPVSLREAFFTAPESISPYCLDVDRRSVTFVRTDSGVDLAEVHPFFYEAQRRQARATITASFEEVESLGADLDGLSTKLAFLYSAGRSGSTVAGRVASALPGVQSISEPDVYADGSMQRRPGDAARDAVLVRMLRATSRILAAHRARIDPSRRVLLIKQRGLGIYGAPLLTAAIPNARSIYLDRNPVAVVDSYLGTFLGHPLVRFARRIGLDRLGVAVVRRAVRFTHPWIPNHMPEVVTESSGDGAAELLARSVASMNQAAVRYAASGLVRFDAFLRYEDLELAPITFARALANGLGLTSGPALTAALASIDGVLTVDAQAGSSVTGRNSRSLSNDDALRVDRIVATHGSRARSSNEVVA